MNEGIGDAPMKSELLRFNCAVQRDPAIDEWLDGRAGALGEIARHWFEVMRGCGDEVRELLHDGCPVACLGDAPFGYVNPGGIQHPSFLKRLTPDPYIAVDTT
jgi:hypothetical protein